MRIVSIEEVLEIHDGYGEIFIHEPHAHPMVIDKNDTLRWVANPAVVKQMEHIDLNRLVALLIAMDFGKESYIYRQLYRDMGVSLSMYMDVFY